jgi:hypothetical protein
MLWPTSPKWWLHSCWRRTIALPFPIVRMAKGKDGWHLWKHSWWWRYDTPPGSVGHGYWRPHVASHRIGWLAPCWWVLTEAQKLHSLS